MAISDKDSPVSLIPVEVLGPSGAREVYCFNFDGNSFTLLMAAVADEEGQFTRRRNADDEVGIRHFANQLRRVEDLLFLGGDLTTLSAKPQVAAEKSNRSFSMLCFR